MSGSETGGMVCERDVHRSALKARPIEGERRTRDKATKEGRRRRAEKIEVAKKGRASERAGYLTEYQLSNQFDDTVLAAPRRRHGRLPLDDVVDGVDEEQADPLHVVHAVHLHLRRPIDRFADGKWW